MWLGLHLKMWTTRDTNLVLIVPYHTVLTPVTTRTRTHPVPTGLGRRVTTCLILRTSLLLTCLYVGQKEALFRWQLCSKRLTASGVRRKKRAGELISQNRPTLVSERLRTC